MYTHQIKLVIKTDTKKFRSKILSDFRNSFVYSGVVQVVLVKSRRTSINDKIKKKRENISSSYKENFVQLLKVKWRLGDLSLGKPMFD